MLHRRIPGQALMALTTACMLAGLLSAPAAASTIIDIRPHSTGFLFSFGNFDSATQFFAQGVVAEDDYLEAVGLQLRGTEDLEFFNVLVTGARADGGGGLGLAPDLDNVLFNSGPNTLVSSSDPTDYDWTVQSAVTSGQTYFIVIDAFSYLTEDSDFWGLGNASSVNDGIDPDNFYSAGEFVWYNTADGETLNEINTSTWERFSSHDTNMSFMAEFSSGPPEVIPEPATLTLLGLGLGGLAARRLRQRR